MPFDPSKPVPGDDLDAVLVRNQLTSLHQLIIDAEVNAATQLSNGITGTSNNSDSVSNLSMGANGSYDPNQLQEIINKIDELINALRR